MRRRQWIIFSALTMLAACAAPRAAPLDDGSTQALARVQAYLDRLRTLQADFLKLSSSGVVSRGTAWMVRPGRLRLDYLPPNKAELVANDSTVSLHDDATDATTTTPLSRTPLAMLLAPRISLTGGVTVTQFERRPGGLVMTMVDTAHPAQGSLTLTFLDDPLVLHGLDLRDARGGTTRLVLSHLRTGDAAEQPIF